MTPSPTPATPADIAGIAAILTDWVDTTPWLPRVHSHADDQGFARLLVDRGWTHVLREGAQVLGFLSRDRAEVHALYVARDARGRGLGKALLAQAKSARPRLVREGFVETGRTDGAGNDEHLPDIRYEWSRR